MPYALLSLLLNISRFRIPTRRFLSHNCEVTFRFYVMLKVYIHSASRMALMSSCTNYNCPKLTSCMPMILHSTLKYTCYIFHTNDGLQLLLTYCICCRRITAQLLPEVPLAPASTPNATDDMAQQLQDPRNTSRQTFRLLSLQI